MYTHLITEQEKENKRNSFYTSLAVHMLLILLLLMIPLKKAIQQEDSLQGIVVDFGNPDGGENTLFEEPLKAEETEEEEAEEASESEETKEVEEVPEQQEEIPAAKVPVQKIEATVTQEKSPIVATDKKAEEKKAETVDKKTEATPSKATQQAKEKSDAEKKAEEQAKKKSQFSSLFGQGSTGETNEKKGDEFGQPDASVLEGLSKGKGEAGDGLDARGLIYEPSISDNSQRSGDVVVRVCVNAAGNVTSAKYTQRGSSTTDSYLINLAEKSAKKYRFTESTAVEQCGTITIHFIVK